MYLYLNLRHLWRSLIFFPILLFAATFGAYLEYGSTEFYQQVKWTELSLIFLVLIIVCNFRASRSLQQAVEDDQERDRYLKNVNLA